MKKYLFLIIILSLFLMQNVNADILPFGKKYVEACFEISNQNVYLDYVFIAKNELLDYKIIELGDCFDVYKLAPSKVYVIKKVDFNEEEIGKDYKEKENYFKNNNKLLQSNLKLFNYPLPNSNDPLDKVVTILNIVELNENNFIIEKSKIIFTYKDGTSEEKTFVSQNITPEPSKKAILPGWFAEFWFVILPLLALAIIVLILLVRKFRK